MLAPELVEGIRINDNTPRSPCFRTAGDLEEDFQMSRHYQ
jgi:hypothetical protein